MKSRKNISGRGRNSSVKAQKQISWQSEQFLTLNTADLWIKCGSSISLFLTPCWPQFLLYSLYKLIPALETVLRKLKDFSQIHSGPMSISGDFLNIELNPLNNSRSPERGKFVRCIGERKKTRCCGQGYTLSYLSPPRQLGSLCRNIPLLLVGVLKVPGCLQLLLT